MDTSKPFINVGFMEFTYVLERSKFENMLKEKANLVKYLDSEEYFNKPGTDVIKAQERINMLRKELEILYGFWWATDQMKNSYECQLEKTHDSYENELVELQKQVQVLEAINCDTVETCYKVMETLIKPNK